MKAGTLINHIINMNFPSQPELPPKPSTPVHDQARSKTGDVARPSDMPNQVLSVQLLLWVTRYVANRAVKTHQHLDIWSKYGQFYKIMDTGNFVNENIYISHAPFLLVFI